MGLGLSMVSRAKEARVCLALRRTGGGTCIATGTELRCYLLFFRRLVG